jgi:uncharacterized membrane protein
VIKRQNLSLRVQWRIAWGALIVLMLAYAAIMSYYSVLRYLTFKSTAFDLGNMDQVVWNTIHGRLFQFTNQGVDWYGPPIRLAVHFEPILLLISPLYLLYADPRTLLVFQTLALAAGALPVFLLTRKYLPQWPLLAVLMAFAYLGMPALVGVNIFDFHPISLATPLLLYAVLALDYQRYRWFVVACVLASFCKEDVPLAVALLGVLVIWKYRKPGLGAGLMLWGVLYCVFAFSMIKYFYPGSQGNNFWYRYEELGSTPGEALVNVIVHPWLVFTLFVTIERVFYLINLIRSSGFLSLLAPEWLLPALPALAINLISTYPLYYSGVYHYNAVIIPFILLSAIHGLCRFLHIWQTWRGEASDSDAAVLANGRQADVVMEPVQIGPIFSGLRNLWFSVIAHPTFTRSAALLQPSVSWLKQRRTYRWQTFSARIAPIAQRISLTRLQWILAIWIFFLIGLNFSIMYVPLSWVNWASQAPGAHEQRIQQILDMIPPSASVSASNTLNPHLTRRQYVTVFPQLTYMDEKHMQNTVQYVVVDLNAIFSEDRVATTKTINQLISSKSFRVLAQAEGVILLVRQ